MSGRSIVRWIDFVLVKPLRYVLEKPERMLKTHVKPGMTVLDVGCGEGHYSIGMAKRVGSTGRVISVDLRAETIEALRKRLTPSPLSTRIEPRLCSDGDLAIDDMAGRVDFALAVYVVHHASDVPLLMRNVYRALKPGGAFLVVEPRHHAGATECEATESAALGAGFTVAGYPRLYRDWAVNFRK
jgi:ubiquinone/menaquinone biosynthesis C-methylase UbiE